MLLPDSIQNIISANEFRVMEHSMMISLNQSPIQLIIECSIVVEYSMNIGRWISYCLKRLNVLVFVFLFYILFDTEM
jgi:hypothetical protein